jgi:glycosyltransferase involved in cell wall biosynthesis
MADLIWKLREGELAKLNELSVFFPCYNEENNIPILLENALSVIPSLAENYQIIIVNDGSKDNSKNIAESLAKQHKYVEVINHPVNKGYGAALRSGFLGAKKTWVFYTDGDNQFDIKELALLIPMAEKYDIISGYRIDRKDPMIRKLNAGLFNLALMILFGLRIKDVDCAFKLYRRELFDKIEIVSNGALVDAEILIKARKLGYRVGQIGVHHFPRTTGKQTGANIRVIFKAFKEILKLRVRL